MTSTLASIICGAVCFIALVGAVAALTWHGSIDGQAAVGFFTGLSIAGVVGGAQHVAAKTGAKAALRQYKEDA